MLIDKLMIWRDPFSSRWFTCSHERHALHIRSTRCNTRDNFWTIRPRLIYFGRRAHVGRAEDICAGPLAEFRTRKSKGGGGGLFDDNLLKNGFIIERN